MTQEEYKKNIREQRQRVNELKQEVAFLRVQLPASYEKLCDKHDKLREHANVCCTCGNRRH